MPRTRGMGYAGALVAGQPGSVTVVAWKISAVELAPQGAARESTRMVRVTALFAQGGIAGSAPILMMVAIFAIFYFLLIMPQQRRQKKWQAMLSQVKPGDRVVTSGGLTGVIMSVKDDVVVLRVPPDNIKIEVTRSSIVTLTTAEARQVLRVAVSHEQESPRQNHSHYCGADRLFVRHRRHSQQLHPQGLAGIAAAAHPSGTRSEGRHAPDPSGPGQ